MATLDTELIIRAGVEGLGQINNLANSIEDAGVNVDDLRQASQRLADEWDSLSTEEQADRMRELTEETRRLHDIANDRITLGLANDDRICQQLEQARLAFERLRDSGTLSQRELARVTELYEQQVRELQQQLNRTAESQDNLGRMTGGIKSAFSGLQGAMAALGVSMGAAELLQMAESFKNLEACIKLVTGEGANFVTAMQGVKEVANSTFNSMEDTGELFSRIAQAGKELGLSQRDALITTKAINQAILISGASAEAASAATMQLSQSLQGGIVRAEEFNAVNENTPRIIKAIADGLGMTQGQLRQYMLDGKLSAEQFMGAIQSQAAVLQKEFNSMPVTVGNAVTQLKNNFLGLIGDIDKELQSSSGLSTFIQNIADGIDNIDPATIEAVKLAFSSLGEMAKTLWDSLGNSIDTLGELWNVFDGTNEAEKQVSALAKALQYLNVPIGFITDGLKAMQIAGEVFSGSMLLSIGKIYEAYLLLTRQSTEAAQNMMNKGGQMLDKAQQHAMEFQSTTIQAFKNTQKTHQQRLDETAAHSKQAYDKMAQDGTASAGKLQEAYIQMMTDAIAANDNVITAKMKAEMAEKGLQATISETGKISITSAQQQQQAVDATAEKTKKLDEALKALNIDTEEFATGINSKATTAMQAFADVASVVDGDLSKLAMAYNAAKEAAGDNANAQTALEQKLLQVAGGNQKLADSIRQTAQAQREAKSSTDLQAQSLDKLGISMDAVNARMSKSGMEMAQNLKYGIDAIKQQATSAESLKIALQQALDVSLQSAKTKQDFAEIKHALDRAGVSAQVAGQQMQQIRTGMNGGSEAVQKMQQAIDQQNKALQNNRNELDKNAQAMQQHARVAMLNADANDQVAESSKKAEDAEKNSQKTFSDGVPSWVAAAYAKMNAMQALGESIDNNRTLVQRFGELMKRQAVADFGSWMRATHEVTTEIERQSDSFKQAKTEAERMTKALGDASVSSDTLSQAQAALSNATGITIAGIIKMDSQTLSNLQNAIDSARAKMQSLADDAKKTADSLEANLAKMQGNDDKARQIEQSKKLADIEEKLNQARKRGNSEEIAQLERALDLQQQINSEETRQAEVQKQEKAQQQIEQQTRQQSSTTSRVTNMPSGQSISASDIADAWDERIRQAEQRGAENFARQLQQEAQRRAN
ncbi:tape measure protein [Acinetobacter sp. c3-l95]|uniref:tape measure protein n=1 Tax=Acinetobacter sp. c3-l95 TaxID=3342804 RepID=UPI0035B9C6B9